MHTRLTEATQEGELAKVLALLATGMNVDGDDAEKKFDGKVDGCVTGAPYYRPLSEAARYNNVDVMAALLERGANIDAVDYRGETALILAVGQECLAAVKMLLERGADPHRISCIGNALAAVQPGYHAGAAEMIQTLLAAGVSPTATASYTQPAIDQWLHPLKDKQLNKRVAKGILEALRLVLPHAGERAPDVATHIAKLEKKLGVAAKAAAKVAASYEELAAAGGSASFAKDVRKQLGSIRKEKDRAAIEQICKVVLAHPSAIANPAWPKLVEDIVALSLTYSDAAEAAYGKRLSLKHMEDDEGGTMDLFADEHLYTWDWVLELLAKPAAIAHPQWADLVIDLSDAKRAAVSYYSFGDDEMAKLLVTDEAKAHPRYAEIVGVARAAFPYASCFNADGALRDFEDAKRSRPAKAGKPAAAKARPEPKAKPKPKTKTKAKPKAKPKTKTKPKTKAKPKTKPKRR